MYCCVVVWSHTIILFYYCVTLMYRKKSTLSGRNHVAFVMRKFSVSLPVSAMIVKQGNNFTTPKMFKKVCKTLFVTVTIVSPNLLLNDCCFKIIVDTRKITDNFHMTKVTFLIHFQVREDSRWHVYRKK